MKVYSRVVGVLMTLFFLTLFVAIIVNIFEQEKIQEKILFAFLLIPSISFLHFMYIHKFGFSYSAEIPNFNRRLNLFMLFAPILITVLVPFGYLLGEIKLDNQLEKAIDRGVFNSSKDDFSAKLKTSYYDHKIHYVMNLVIPPNEPDYSYHIMFLDENGFKVGQVPLLSRDMIKDQNGYYVNSSSMSFNKESYSKISDWLLIYFEQ